MPSNRIIIEQDLFDGIPCIRNLGIPAAVIVDMFAEDMSAAEILEAFPGLERDDIREALRCAADAIRESRRAVESHDRTRRRGATQVRMMTSEEPVELIAQVVKLNAIRARYVATGEAVTFRPLGGIRWDVEGEILTVKPSKVWKHGRTQYISGTVLSRRIDVTALGLIPLELRHLGIWDPADKYWTDKYSPIEEYLKSVIAAGPRPMFEMELVPHGSWEEGSDCYPIYDAEELRASGDYEGADRIIETLLIKDLRCIDVHAHLGNRSFSLISTLDIEKAKRHFEVGMSIAGLTLGKDFGGVLPWSQIGNRPFLRCLFGFGLCQRRLGDLAGARDTFMRMLWLDPEDSQGVEELIEDMGRGLPGSDAY